MKFNPNDYAMVEERLAELHAKYEDARIETICHIPGTDGKWLFEARIYLSAGDQANGLFKASGFASEREQGAQANWSAEVCETSSIGRSLANLGLTGSRKKRASYEEMLKVERVSRDWLAEATKITDIEGLRLLWAEANAARVSEDILGQIKELANDKSSSSSELGGSEGSVPASNAKKTAKRS